MRMWMRRSVVTSGIGCNQRVRQFQLKSNSSITYLPLCCKSIYIVTYDNIHCITINFTSYMYNLSQVATVSLIPCLGVVQDRLVLFGSPCPFGHPVRLCARTKLLCWQVKCRKRSKDSCLFDLSLLIAVWKTTLFCQLSETKFWLAFVQLNWNHQTEYMTVFCPQQLVLSLSLHLRTKIQVGVAW